MNSKELREIEHQAERDYLSAKRDYENAITDEIEAAKRQIKKQHEREYARVGELSNIHAHATRARQDAEIEEAKASTLVLKNGVTLRPGDKIYRTTQKHRQWSTKNVTERGTVEVATRTTVLPENMGHWRMPDPGPDSTF